MPVLDVGRVCMKIAGREAGKYCVVLKTEKDKKKKAFVLITGPKLLTGVKRRRCNIEHLEPLPHVLEIKEEASEEEVIEAFEKAKLVKKLKLKKPSAAKIKEEMKKAEKKEEKSKGKPEKKKKTKEKKKGKK